MRSVNNKIFNKVNLLDIKIYECINPNISPLLRTKFWRALGAPNLRNPRSICILLKNKNF